ncbi:hypothetical protein V8C35DRAFT_5444 [Trichoderma chlorosporum]
MRVKDSLTRMIIPTRCLTLGSSPMSLQQISRRHILVDENPYLFLLLRWGCRMESIHCGTPSLTFKKVLTDDQRRELHHIMVIPDADAVLIFTAEPDSINRNREGLSLASRLHPVLQSVRDFSAAIEAFDSTCMGIAPMLWGSVKLTMIIAVKFVTYYDALSKCFMDLGAFCPRWTDFQIFYSHSPQLQNVLCGFYGRLIHCCKRAIETIQRSCPTQS